MELHSGETARLLTGLETDADVPLSWRWRWRWRCSQHQWAKVDDDDEDEGNDWQLLWLAAFSLTFCDSTRGPMSQFRSGSTPPRRRPRP